MSKEQAIEELVAATRKLVNCKGRFHTAQNYAEVVEALEKYEACSSAPGTPEAPILHKECIWCDGTGYVRGDDEDPASEDECERCRGKGYTVAAQLDGGQGEGA